MFCCFYSSNGYSGRGVSYTLREIAQGFKATGADVSVHVPWKLQDVPDIRYCPAVPKLLDRPLRSFVPSLQSARMLRELERSTDRQTFAYLWPDAPLPLVKAIKRRGIPIVREMINCHVATAQRLLGDAYRARGLGTRTPITDAHIAYERAMLELCDRAVVSNECAAASLVENGVPESRIIRSSYGWEPERVGDVAQPSKGMAGLTYLFVGTLCVRKGVDTLVEAWRRSGVDGRLLLVGAIDPAFADRAAQLIGGSVEHVDYTSDISAVLRSADVFVFPSLEEGGPLVTYEAAGAGLPLVTTPMGAARVLADGRNGIEVPPEDVESLAAALRKLADDPALRAQMAAESRIAADEFIWPKVARKRAEVIGRSLFD